MFLPILFANSAQAQNLVGAEAVAAERYNTSIPLREMPAVSGMVRGFPYAIRNKIHDFTGVVYEDVFNDDPVIDDGEYFGGFVPTATVDISFEGVSADDSDAVAVRVAPPDTDGDIGPNHYVQWVNLAAEIFDRTGTSLMGPFAGNQFFQGLGGDCQNNNSGDPIVIYDEQADRWFVSQFSINRFVANFLCIAISTTPDPTGSYHQYAFPWGTAFPDYPKFGVWPDAYLGTTRVFDDGPFYQEAVVFDRANMLVGNPATMQRFTIPLSVDGWLPADLDGPVPPAGTPGIFGGMFDPSGAQQFRLYEFDVDWVTPGNSTFTSLATLNESPYSFVNSNIPQAGTGQTLDRLAHFTMHRLQYRNFGTHQTLVTNHTVQAGGRAAPRWLEMRKVGAGAWGIQQEGTYAPAGDSHHRWMGSAAMNGAGEIALGYSVSSSTQMPDIRFTGQTTAAAAGVMDAPETVIQAGGGVQTGLDRWGDYSRMAVDPTSDEQFWFTSEYYAASGSFDWKTKIAGLSIGDDIPVELTGFSATANGSDINLVWATSSETNNAGFEIQLQGEAEFDVVGYVEGHGTTTVEQSYSYTISDLAPGMYTVRFKQIDFDGAYEYGPEVEVGIGVPGTHVLSAAYPNPFNPQASFNLSVATTQHVEIVLYNAIGQQVQTLFSGEMEGGQSQSVIISGVNLPSGPYYYQIVGGTFTDSGRVTLLK